MHITSLLPLLLAPGLYAAHLRVNIPSSLAIPNPGALPPSTTASLTTITNKLSSPLRLDNTFDFRNVSTGSYLLDIHCHTHAFAPLRIDVHDESKLVERGAGAVSRVNAWGTFRGNEWENKGEEVVVKEIQKDGIESAAGSVWEFDVKVLIAKEYLLERSGFSPLSILKNPMILIAIASMGIVFGMPYLMDNMDPELKAEFEASQKSNPMAGGAAANPLQNFDAAAWLAGSKKPDAKPEPVAGQGKITR